MAPQNVQGRRTWTRFHQVIDVPLRVMLAQRRYDEARARLIERLGIELPPLEASVEA